MVQKVYVLKKVSVLMLPAGVANPGGARASVYDSEGLAAAYAVDRPPVHEQILRSVRLGRRDAHRRAPAIRAADRPAVLPQPSVLRRERVVSTSGWAKAAAARNGQRLATAPIARHDHIDA